jgi:hypothetical protein
MHIPNYLFYIKAKLSLARYTDIWGSKCITVNLGSRWRTDFSLMPRPLYHWEKQTLICIE